MPNIDRLYVQTLGQELPPEDTGDVYKAKLARLRELMTGADAIAVGVGSGMSTAAGYDFYHANPLVDEALAPFEQAHGFSTLFEGLYHVFGSNEEQWAFNAAVTKLVSELPVGEPYRDLASVLAEKDHFILTTNIDGQVPRAFDASRIWTFQGDLRYLQCSQPCTDEIVDFSAQARVLVETTQLRDGIPRIPHELLPRCEECHHLMAPWVRDEGFLEGKLWHEQRERYETFLRRHLVERHDKVLFLELGVSSMTPAIIKLPFWDMVARNPQTFYVQVDRAEASTPSQLSNRAIVITADLARVMRDLDARKTEL